MKSVDRVLLDVGRATLQRGSRMVDRLEQLVSRRNAVAETRPQPPAEYQTEADMLPQLHEVAMALWVGAAPEHTWMALEEQILHSRIADLVLVRVDVEAVRERLRGGWARPLRLAELRALHALRPDRPTSVSTVAVQARMSSASVIQVLRTLAGDEFAVREPGGGYRRLAPVGALVQRVVTFEAKRDDPRGALQQARGHRAWANETYVAFDSRYGDRFRAVEEQYSRLGVGLLELSPFAWRRIIRSRPHRRPNRLETGLIGERALGRLLGEPPVDRPERRLPHGHRLARPSEPIISGRSAAWLAGVRDSR